MDTAKLYVDSNRGLIDSVAAASTAAVLTALVKNQDHITFSSDEHGHFFQVPAEVADQFRAFVGDGEEAATEPEKRKPGRPRKAVDPDPEE